MAGHYSISGLAGRQLISKHVVCSQVGINTSGALSQCVDSCDGISEVKEQLGVVQLPNKHIRQQQVCVRCLLMI